MGVAGVDPSQFSIDTNTCTTTVAVNSTCQVDVTFTPTSTGAKTATVQITSNAPGSPHTVTLTATGTPVPTPVTGTKKQTLRPKLPKRIKRSGLTLITPANAITNAGQTVRTIIRGGPLQAAAAGEVRTFTVVRGPNGKTSVRTFGNPNLRITVTQPAPAVEGYRAFTRTGVYVKGTRR